MSEMDVILRMEAQVRRLHGALAMANQKIIDQGNEIELLKAKIEGMKAAMERVANGGVQDRL